ncbi:peptidoglycan DD-metalloendopeptidase family protein [Novosphingobium sp. FSY-8]|uniref:Peptidoglycan DD-metalloendopeptidase family protein n=1 Tax=Novosphingobium ovatum TaxID=1908523 RepID=A0ABW9XET4_9SPHN|nr:peptidoglycan DD-metalloendopeptidase family protein [Novosphingobium ovatum]
MAKIGAIAAALVLIPNTAQANSSANADIAAPLRAAQVLPQGLRDTGDAQFAQLFGQWRNMDGSAPVDANARPVAIPSRVPLDGVRLTSDFGMRTHPVLGGYRMHKGIDLSSAIGTPVYATADGVIGRADWFSGYGLYIQIEHGGAMQTRYGHLSRLNVAAGQMVRKGDLIGYVGTTGRSTGPHLHYEVRIEGVAVNPIPYMQGDGQARLALADTSDPSGQ